MSAIEVINLQRDFQTTIGVFKREKKTVTAVKDISFEIADGELFGLLGYTLFRWFEITAKKRGTLEVF